MITLQELRLGYGSGPDVLVVHEAMELPEHALISLIGPNGGGKTTLLRCAAGLLKPRGGTVRLRGEPLYGPGAISRDRRARVMAVVLTETVFPAYLRVRELVSLGRLPYGGRDSDAAIQRALAYTESEYLARRYVGSLSDGERQRVMVARALAQEPEILLLDEPTSHLDPPHQTALFQLLRCLVESRVIETAVIATHQLHLALYFSDLLVLVNRSVRQGTTTELTESGAVAATFAPHTNLGLDTHRGWFVPEAPLQS